MQFKCAFPDDAQSYSKHKLFVQQIPSLIERSSHGSSITIGFDDNFVKVSERHGKSRNTWKDDLPAVCCELHVIESVEPRTQKLHDLILFELSRRRSCIGYSNIFRWCTEFVWSFWDSMTTLNAPAR